MSDEKTTPDKTLDNLFSFPPVLTIKSWDVYFQGKQTYINQHQRDGKAASAVIAQYAGALRLIKDGLVHVSPETPEQLTRWLYLDPQSDDFEATPLPIMFYVVQEVSVKVEDSFFETLPWAKRKPENKKDDSTNGSTNESSPTS